MTAIPAFEWKANASFDQRFDFISQNFADRAALICGSIELTYAELSALVRSTSKHIYSAISPQDAQQRAAVYLPRSAETVHAILACQNAGVQYVPVDTSYPKDRVAYMLNDSQPDLIITRSELLDKLPNIGALPHILQIDLLPTVAGQKSKPNCKSQGYVIYTSGSTGKPKGVNMGGRSLQNLIQWQCELTDLPPSTRTGQFAPISFDVSFQEIFSTLCSGGTLVMFSQDQKIDPFALLDEIRRTKINRLFVPFVALNQIAQSAATMNNYPDTLREIHTAGEQLVVSNTLRSFFEHMPKCRLFNQYGPSETHVVSCHTLSCNQNKWDRLPAIGKALPNVGLHVLDADENLVPEGSMGELYVTGSALADGYLNRIEQTTACFPIINLNGEFVRAYKTGDRVKVDRTGQLHFSGRIDQQIKFNGYRVDPGEIESTLTDHEQVAGSVVVFDAEAIPSGALYACITATTLAQGTELPVILGEYLRNKLPEYMLPTKLSVVEFFPTTPSGKVDRRMLLNQMKQDYNDGFEATENLADSILSYWRTILGIPTLSPRDNVFEHGVKSIMLPEFQRYMLSSFDLRIAAARVFQFPTTEGLVAQLGSSSPPRNDEIITHPTRSRGSFNLLRKRLNSTPVPSDNSTSTIFPQKEV